MIQGTPQPLLPTSQILSASSRIQLLVCDCHILLRHDGRENQCAVPPCEEWMQLVRNAVAGTVAAARIARNLRIRDSHCEGAVSLFWYG